MEPAREIELKFLLDAAGAEAVLAALPPGETTVRDLHAVYYDTADHALRKAGFALRVRRSGGSRTQTLKSTYGADGGRDEWEWPVNTDAPDRDLLAETPAPDIAGTLLELQFIVRSRRTIREVREGGSLIELVIDDTEVTAGERREAFLELELELKSGRASALFALARRLAKAVPLRLSVVSKAERGYRLAAEAGVRRPCYRAPALSVDLDAGQAFQALGGACLAQLCATAESLRRTPGPEGVHQLRVAIRRFRAALTTFRPVVAGKRRDWVKTELKWLARELGEARNLDVFIASVWRPAAKDQHDAPGMADFGRALLTAQTRAYTRAATMLESRRFRVAVLEMAAWLQLAHRTRRPAGGGSHVLPAVDYVAAALDRRRDRILRKGRRLADLDGPTRHQLRIKAKVLRYAAEDLGALFPAHHHRAERFIDAVKTLQDALGAMNDLAFSEGLARDVALADGSRAAAFAAGRLSGARARDEAELLKASLKAFDAFADARPFW